MNVFIALYRGINVGGKNSVKMESLRAMHERLGHGEVTSYIQSGNVVFTAAGTAPAILRKTSQEFANEFGFAAKLMVVEAKQFDAVVRGSPYAKFGAKSPKTVHAALCEDEPNNQGLKALLAKTGGSETFAIKQNVIYLHAPDGFGTSKFAAGMEKASGTSMTVRNWRTIEALAAMATAITAAPARTPAGGPKAGR